MEFVNQFIAFLTPYLGEYARYAPIAIGAFLAIIAMIIRRRALKQMRARMAAAKKKGTDSEKTSEHGKKSEKSTEQDVTEKDITEGTVSERSLESAMSSANEQTEAVEAAETAATDASNMDVLAEEKKPLSFLGHNALNQAYLELVVG